MINRKSLLKHNVSLKIYEDDLLGTTKSFKTRKSLNIQINRIKI